MKTPAWTRHALWVMPLALGLQSAVVAGDEQPSKTSSYSPVVINEDFATIAEAHDGEQAVDRTGPQDASRAALRSQRQAGQGRQHDARQAAAGEGSG